MILKPMQRILQLDKLIRMQATGNAENLAKHLKISKRQVYNYIEELRLLGIDIEYCRHKKTFIYSDPIELEINFRIKKLSWNESIDIFGGSFLNVGFVKCNFTNLLLF